MSKEKNHPSDDPCKFNVDMADGSNQIVMVCGEENARRIVACLNICNGIETEFIEHHINLLDAEADAVLKIASQRDALLAALKEARHHVVISPDPVRGGFLEEIDAAIDAVIGGEA